MLELVCEHCFVEPEPARKADFDAIVGCLPMVWGEQIKAIARPENAASISFHRDMGMEAVEVPDYSGLGRARVVFSARLTRHRGSPGD
jgi:hypothetical protein